MVQCTCPCGNQTCKPHIQARVATLHTSLILCWMRVCGSVQASWGSSRITAKATLVSKRSGSRSYVAQSTRFVLECVICIPFVSFLMCVRFGGSVGCLWKKNTVYNFYSLLIPCLSVFFSLSTRKKQAQNKICLNNNYDHSTKYKAFSYSRL